MSLGKLGSTLTREFKRNPQKSAILVLLIPVALWFWAPLVMKWFGSSAPQAAVVVTPTASAPVAPIAMPVVMASANAEVSSQVWETAVKKMAEDELTKSASLPSNSVDPFQLEAIFKQETLPKKEELVPEPERKPIVFDPSQFDLKLQGTLVSANNRTATINGRRFREGQAMWLDGRAVRPNEKSVPEEQIIVLSIQSNYVVLWYAEQEAKLTIQRPTFD